MLESLSGLNNITKLNNADFKNIYKFDNFLGENGASQGLENFTKIDDGFRKIDFSSISENDPELKADLQGFVEKNQAFDNSLQDSNEITPGEVANNFSNVLGNFINDVNSKNKEAEKAVETFVSGGNIDLHSVMIASEKAGLSMQLAMQMKNKIVQAYQEISRTQI